MPARTKKPATQPQTASAGFRFDIHNNPRPVGGILDGIVWRSVPQRLPDGVQLSEEVDKGVIAKGDVGGVAALTIDELQAPEMAVAGIGLPDLAGAGRDVDGHCQDKFSSDGGSSVADAIEQRDPAAAAIIADTVIDRWADARTTRAVTPVGYTPVSDLYADFASWHEVAFPEAEAPTPEAFDLVLAKLPKIRFEVVGTRATFRGTDMKRGASLILTRPTRSAA
ncbi:hypothetical protein [uncultured Sphingomonas sp.]|uniref:hypothetical protein n=1 Tax=uncultured Sphingomonas sp. TaxID=158754 RepID=UPI0025E7D464|nr:hypothetical protein [uncultured Sphingomonas sp.]